MSNIKKFEEFNLGYDFNNRINKFYQGISHLIEENPPQFELENEDLEINSIGDVIRFIRTAPKNVINWCKVVYYKNKEYIDKLTTEFKGVNEEICILTLLSLGLMALSIYWNRHHIKRMLNSRGYKRKELIQGYRKGKLSDKSKPKVKSYSNMSKSELQKEMDRALDDRDYSKAKEISKYLQ